jgi:hypothetical protein
MSIPDSKKKRDQKSSETEKELALANLQDLFLGSKAPKADFLENAPVSISPALLPKKDNIQLSSENAQNFGEHQLPLSLSNIKTKPSTYTKIEEPKKEIEREVASDILKPRHTAFEPPAQPAQPTEPAEAKPTTTSKPLTTFDLLAVGLDSTPEKPVSKTKSFLAHFAKKISKNPKDPQDNK